MKVVLFCGGLGLRLRDGSEQLPKPMVHIGYRPILWHVMKYYAHFGHKDFILCLGYRGDLIKQYFRHYDECISNDFVLSHGGRHVELVNSDIADWRITFADTGVNSNVGQRLLAVHKYLEGDEYFLANYSDGLTDLHLPTVLELFRERDCVASFLSVKPNLSFHVIAAGPSGLVDELKAIKQADLRVNGGFFMFKQEIFEYLRDGEELVQEPFQRLIAARQLFAHPYEGFFATMDTFKDKQQLDELDLRGVAPWQVWKTTLPSEDATRLTAPRRRLTAV